MMTLALPWSLLGLIPVAGVAIWALFRPGRNLAVVASLSLWRAAADALGSSMLRKARRLGPSWLLLLAGAVAAVLAASGPVHQTQAPWRRVAIAVYPSVEVAGVSRGQGYDLHFQVRRLLDRLAPSDKVRLILPDMMGGATDWLSPYRAKQELQRAYPLPVPAGELVIPQAGAGEQHLYRFAPAGMRLAGGPNVSNIEVRPFLPPVTIDAMGASPLPNGRASLFVAVLNQTGLPQRCRLKVGFIEGPKAEAFQALEQAVSIPPGERVGISREIAAAAAIFAELEIPDAGGVQPGCEAFLVRREADVRRVALVGSDEPLLRRFIAAHAGLVTIADAQQADLVIANGADPSPGKPALVIDPPTSPAGWRRGRELEAVVLEKLNVAPHLVMANVDLSAVAVRRVRPWAPVTASWDESLAYNAEGAFILKPPPGSSGGVRKIYVAFDLAEPNTNFGTLPDFVIFLAAAVDYLAPVDVGKTAYVSVTPLRVGANPDWAPVRGRLASNRADERHPLHWPGIYRDAAGTLHAVSLTGLRGSAAPAVPVDEVIANLPLPEPQYAEQGLALWPALAAAAGVLWLLGWAARTR